MKNYLNFYSIVPKFDDGGLLPQPQAIIPQFGIQSSLNLASDINKTASLSFDNRSLSIEPEIGFKGGGVSFSSGSPDSLLGLTTTTIDNNGNMSTTNSNSDVTTKSTVKEVLAGDKKTGKGNKAEKDGPEIDPAKVAKWSNRISAASLFLDNALLSDKNFGAQSAAIDAGVHGASKALLSSGNPWAMAAGAGLEAANFLSKAGGQTVEGFDVDIQSSGYGNLGHMESSSSRDLFGLKTLFNPNGMKDKLKKRNELAQMALKACNIADEIKFEQEARMNSVDDTIQKNQIALAGGIDTSVLVAKEGAKLEQKEESAEEIWNEVLNLLLDEPQVIKAQNGAKLELIEVSEQPSVIPSGAMHKNKNHLDLNITEKGIPVITVKDDDADTFDEIKKQEDSLVLHAEVEEAEIIFNKELTIFIESLRKQWHEADKKDDDICLEAGMRIAKEIVENTEDNTDVTEKSIVAVENEEN